MKRQIKFILLLFMLLTIVVPSGSALSAENRQKPKQVIVVIDRLMLRDFSEKSMPNLASLQKNGASGLMNTNTLDGRPPANTYITIASGQLTKGGAWAGNFFNVSDYMADGSDIKTNQTQTAGQLYTALTGWPTGKAAIVNPGIVDMVKINSNRKKTVRIGMLGAYLGQFGISRSVIGNADTNVPRRFAASLVMDDKGRVPSGVIDSSILAKDPGFPFGLRTDYIKTISETASALKTNDLAVVELGDLSRLEEYRSEMSEKTYTRTRTKVINNIDDSIGRLIPLLDFKKDRLIVLVPTPSSDDQKNKNTVTPVIITGGKITAGSLLTSATTRHNGLISNIDIAPTILAFYNITKEQTELDGRPVTTVSATNTPQYLKDFNHRLVLNYIHRPAMLYLTAVLEIIGIIFSLPAIRFSRSKTIITWFQRTALVFLVIPTVFLFYKFISFPSVYLSLVTVIFAVALAAFLLEKIPAGFQVKLALISMVTTMTIIVDLFSGYNLMVNSPLGYDLMIGARYYGIGNEFSGILLGATLLGAACLTQFFADRGQSRLKKLLLAVYLFAVAVVIYAPGLGAEAGSFIAALAAFTYFIILINGGKMTAKRVAGLALGILVVLFAGATVDHIFNGAAQSHIGKAMGQLLQGDWQAIQDIIVRKLLMNWRLMQFSIWSRVLLAVIAGLTFFTFYPKGIFRALEAKHRYIYIGIKAIIVASIIGFAFNDSGIVEAATASIYVIFPLIYMVLEEKKI